MEKFISLPEKDNLSVAELAHALGVHISTAWRFLLHGVRGRQLPSYRVGARRRIRRADVVAWLEAINGGNDDAKPESPREQRADQNRKAQIVEQQLDAEGF